MRSLLISSVAVLFLSSIATAAVPRAQVRSEVRKGDTVVVVAQRAPLQIESTVVSRLDRGQRLNVLLVRTTRDGKWLWTECSGEKGWVNCQHVGKLVGEGKSQFVLSPPSIELVDPYGDTTPLFAASGYDTESEVPVIQYRNYNLPWATYPDLD